MFKSRIFGPSPRYGAESIVRADVPASSSFLPQDKVASFARMTPQQLLIQTQFAAGDEHLSSWHKDLIENGDDLRKHMAVRMNLILFIQQRYAELSPTQTLESDVTELRQLEDKNKELERDVARWKERCQLEREVRYT